MTERYGLAQLEALTLPDTWWELPLEPDGGGWASETAAAMHDDAAVQRGLAVELRRLQGQLGEEPHAHLAIGVWLPDASPAAVAGFVTIDWFVPDAEHDMTPESYRDLMAPRAGDPVRLDRVVDDVELPAGPAVRIREVVATPRTLLSWRRQVQRAVTYAAFPPRCTDAVQLRFVTPHLELTDELEADAAAAAATLRVLVDDGSTGAWTAHGAGPARRGA